MFYACTTFVAITLVTQAASKRISKRDTGAADADDTIPGDKTDGCWCNGLVVQYNGETLGNCTPDESGLNWCWVNSDSTCSDLRTESRYGHEWPQVFPQYWSYVACVEKKRMFPPNVEPDNNVINSGWLL